MLLTGIEKSIMAEWQKCRNDLNRDCDRVRKLSDAKEAERGNQRDLEAQSTKRGKAIFCCWGY